MILLYFPVQHICNHDDGIEQCVVFYMKSAFQKTRASLSLLTIITTFGHDEKKREAVNIGDHVEMIYTVCTFISYHNC